MFAVKYLDRNLAPHPDGIHRTNNHRKSTLIESQSCLNPWLLSSDLKYSHYLFQPIYTRLLFYNDNSEENKDKKSEAKSKWNTIYSTLQDVLRAAVGIAIDRDQLTQEDKKKYFHSGMPKDKPEVTENWYAIKKW